ncbi:hypothetical protein Tco_0863527 [Tanacetum coccineum]
MVDYMFTIIKVVSRHEDTQLYGAILPNKLTNEDIRNSKYYKEYYAIASGAVPPKIKVSVKKMQVESDTSKTPPTAKGKRLKTSLKADKPAKKKKPAKTSNAKGLTKSSDEEDDDEVSLNDDDDDDEDADNQDDDDQDDNDQDDENQDDDNEQTDSDNNGNDFVHPMFSTHDEEEREEESFDPRVQTPSHAESTDDESNEESDEEVQGANTEDEEMNEEATHEEDEANELYRDVNVNLEGRDTVMTDAPLPTIQATQETEDTHVIITAPITPEGQQQSSSVSSGFITNMLNPRTDTCIDSIFTLNTEATSLVDVSVTTIVEPPLVSATTLPPPPTPLIIHIQQTPVPTLTTVPSSYLQDLPNFALYSGLTIDLKLWKLTSLSSSKQTNLLKQSLLFLSIIDAYLANKMHEAVKTVVQLQSERLRDEAQAENADFLNKLDDNIKKIIKDQVKEQVKAQVSKILPKIKKTVNEQLEAEVMTRSSTESKTSLL